MQLLKSTLVIPPRIFKNHFRIYSCCSLYCMRIFLSIGGVDTVVVETRNGNGLAEHD